MCAKELAQTATNCDARPSLAYRSAESEARSFEQISVSETPWWSSGSGMTDACTAVREHSSISRGSCIHSLKNVGKFGSKVEIDSKCTARTPTRGPFHEGSRLHDQVEAIIYLCRVIST